MIKKQIQRHDFLMGGPVLQYEIPFPNEILNVDNVTTLLGDYVINYNTTNFRPQITLNNAQGDIIFRVDEDRVVYYDQELVTEDRVREIVEERVREILNERNTDVL